MKLIRAGVQAFKIFDSIQCLPEDKEIVRKELLEAFSVYNITPTINYKDYNNHA